MKDAVGDYLDKIGRYPLLSPEQEFELATQVQTGVARSPNLSVEGFSSEDALTIRRAFVAKEKLVRSNLRLVVAIAKKYVSRNTALELLDLIQEGSIGLARGVDKFDPSKGYKLSTYVYWWIRQGITRAISDRSRMIRIPVHVTEKSYKIRKVTRDFRAKHDRTPSISELTELTGLSASKIRLILEDCQVVRSRDVKVGDDERNALIDSQIDESCQPIDWILMEEQKAIVDYYLSFLTPRERHAMELRYGIVTGDECTLAEVGKGLGISRERARQIQTKALRRVRNLAQEDYSESVC